MPARRIASLWFPRLGAERLLRGRRSLPDDQPFAVTRDTGQMQVLSSLSLRAEEAGLIRNQPLRDAMAMCPALQTRLRNPQAEAAFLTTLRRWAGRFSPWVTEEGEESLVMDITGCAHLFGGEKAMLTEITAAAADLGLTVRSAIAGTRGAAWGLARFAGATTAHNRNGDAIDQEARATRSRAAKRRHWERGGAAPARVRLMPDAPRIAPSDQTRSAISPLPLAALRLDENTQTQLSRLGLRSIGDLLNQPRAPLARRFGTTLVLRLDQALGAVPEPISPARPDTAFATRLSLPDPIGLEGDILAGLDRLLPRMCQRLRDKGRGARRVRLQAFRSDRTMGWIETGLARPAADPDRIRPLLALKLTEIDAGHGIDMLRLEAVVTEPLHPKGATGHAEALGIANKRLAGETALEDLVGRLGTRVGLDAITRHHPGDSHIPEKSAQTHAAAWSEAAPPWPAPMAPRPAMLWRPEPVTAPSRPNPPRHFRWRGRDFTAIAAEGPERICPEWWLEEPEWRSGPRDYWRVTTAQGDRLWLFYAHGAALSDGWFCHGSFA
mgnify:CR=1 FL=1